MTSHRDMTDRHRDCARLFRSDIVGHGFPFSRLLIYTVQGYIVIPKLGHRNLG